MGELTAVVAFFNMRREAARTLFTLSAEYQLDVTADEYNIIAIDNGSLEPLNPREIESLGSNISYRFVETESMSPAAALNAAVDSIDSRLILCMIDGARMVTPNLVRRALDETVRNPGSFVYAPSFHLGSQLQNDSVINGYDQTVEDDLLDTIDWRADGTRLFSISNVRAVPERLMAPTFESNCFVMERQRFVDMGGFNERFQSAGGGLVNWEFFRRAVASSSRVVSLLGEASFHQFHGGASTNHTRKDHPFASWLREYEAVVGEPFRYPDYTLELAGSLSPTLHDVIYGANALTTRAVAERLIDSNHRDSGVAALRQLSDDNPNDPTHLRVLSQALIDVGRLAEAEVHIQRAIVIAPTQAELYATLARLRRSQGLLADARTAVDRSLELDPLQHEASFELGLIHRDEGDANQAITAFERAIDMNGTPTGPYVVQLAFALAESDRHDEALPVATAWTNEHPDDLQAVLDLAAIAELCEVDADDDIVRRIKAAFEIRKQPSSSARQAADWLTARDHHDLADRAWSHVELSGIGVTIAGAPVQQARRRWRKATPKAATNETFDESLVERFTDSVLRSYAHVASPTELLEHAIHGSVYGEDQRALADFVADRRPARTLEIGTYLGLGTAILLAATERFNGSVTTIDPSIRHRIFDDPLAHATTFVGESARVSFNRGFFGLRTDGGIWFDAQHFEPRIDDAELHSRLDALPVQQLTDFDLVVFDPGLAGLECLWLIQQAALAINRPGVLLVCAAGAPAVTEATEQTAMLFGARVDRLTDQILTINLD